MTILVVEDQADIANLVRINLEMLGYAVRLCANLEQARAAVAEGHCSMLVLDLGLPDGDGLDFCRQLRAASATLPILILTARTSEHERVHGLETGADDYLTKPFSILELQARVKALLRRAGTMAASTGHHLRLEFGDLVIDSARREVSRGGRPVELTSTEFDLLLYLARHPGQVFSREQLLSRVWQYNHAGYEHTVNSHINRLRGKLEADPAHPHFVRTVWGVGYKFMGQA